MKKNIIEIILLSLLVLTLILLIFFVFTYFKEKADNKLIIENESEKIEIQRKEIEEDKKRIQENNKNLYNEQFPDFIEGTLIIISETEAKIKTEEGKEFLVDPARPIEYYLESNVQNGSGALLQGKIIDEKTVFLGNIKPLIAE